MGNLTKADFSELGQIALMFIAMAVIALGARAPLWTYPLLGLVFIFAITRKKIRLSAGLISRCFAPIFLGLLVVMLYVFIQQSSSILGDGPVNSLKYAQFSETYKEQFYSAISTLFAIIVALALVKGIEDVDSSKKNIAEESQAIRSIWNYLRYFEENELDNVSSAARKALRSRLIRYINNVCELKDSKNPATNRACLNECRNLILKIEPVDRDDRIAQEEIIRQFELIASLRTKRIGSNGGKISWYLKGALWLMSIALVLPFLAEPLCVDSAYITKLRVGFHDVEDPSQRSASPKVTDSPADKIYPGIKAASQLNGPSGSETSSTADFCVDPRYPHPNPQRASQYYMIFVMVAFFSFLLLMLHDISSPDHGFWRVDMQAFTDLRKDLGRETRWKRKPRRRPRRRQAKAGAEDTTAR